MQRFCHKTTLLYELNFQLLKHFIQVKNQLKLHC